MAASATLPLPYPEVARHRGGHASRADSGACRLAPRAPARPRRVLLCPRRRDRRARCTPRIGWAVVWLDAHGDLNTGRASPSGNVWGMPLRMLLDAGTVRARGHRCSLVPGASTRRSRPSSQRAGCASDYGRASALPLKELTPSTSPSTVTSSTLTRSVVPFMPEPGGLSTEAATATLERRRHCKPLAGVGLTGLTADPGKHGATRPLCRRTRPLTNTLRYAVMSSRYRRLDRASRRAAPTDGAAVSDPNTCPQLRLALPRRRARTRTSASARTAATTSRCERGTGSRSSSTRDVRRR